MRDTRAWNKPLVKELNDECVKPLLGVLKPWELCALELGLSFLADHLAGEGIGALWPVLSGYMRLDPSLDPQIRTLRELMGPLAKTGTMHEKLDLYVRLPEQVRGFEPVDMAGHKPQSSTVFTRRSSPYAAGRHDLYRQKLGETVPYKLAPTYRPAPSGEVYSFSRADGSWEQVRIPKTFVPGPPPPVLTAALSRTREPVPLDLPDLQLAAAEIDRLLEHHPQIKNRDFVKRLAQMQALLAQHDTGTLAQQWRMTIDGLWHVVGLMNSGKSTLLDLIAFIVAHRGGKVGYVLSSGSDVYDKISWLHAVGISAAPIFGRTSAGTHKDRYWRSQLHDGECTFPSGNDHAATFADDQCYLEELRTTARADRVPLPRRERPCRGQLMPAGKRVWKDCPLLSRCPSHAAARAVAEAQAWVTTGAGLAATLMPQSDVEVRVVEAAQHHLTVLLVDEADSVQEAFDARFLMHEVLSQPGRGWSHRIGEQIGQRLEHSWFLDLLDPEITAGDKHFRRHDQAMTELHRMMIDPAAATLRAVVAEGPFTGYSLLRRLSRNLHGLTDRNDFTAKAELEEAADLYFEEHFAELITAPFQAPPEGWAELNEAMTAAHDTKVTPQEAAEAWIQAHPPVADPDPTSTTADLAQLLQAGVWATRITTSFFEVAQRLPAISKSQAEDGESFWHRQPSPDLMPFIPEQAAGNLMALQWQPNPVGDSGAFSLLWLRGVGRWLLYHLHDLLAAEGIQGPNVVLTSATSWMPASPRFHLDTPPNLVLREPEEARGALLKSKMFFRPPRYPDGRPVFTSGTGGNPALHAAALCAAAEWICNPPPGARESLLQQARQRLATDRQQVLFAVQSTRDAQTVADYINNKTPYTALHVIKDDDPPTPHGIPRRRLSSFAKSEADILVASEGAIQRGHNILNARRVAALGAVFYLARIHPPADDATFPLSLLSREAMRRLRKPIDLTGPDPTDPVDLARKLRYGERRRWQRRVGEPVLFSRLTDPVEHAAFVGNFLVPLHQTLGRGIRGNEPVLVYLCDAAFAPRTANLDETAPDTARTSVIVAAQELLHDWLTAPEPTASPAERLDHALAEACWGLASHLLDTIDWGHR